MSKHVHAELMALYAQDALETDKPWERWEGSYRDMDDWGNLLRHPTWSNQISYRRKKPTHIVHGKEVPAPLKTAKENMTVWYVWLGADELVFGNSYINSQGFRTLLKNGAFFASREDAIANARALYPHLFN